MAQLRKPYTGVWNIVRFNWHMFIVAVVLIISLILVAQYTDKTYRGYLWITSGLITITTLVSLAVSYYVYDCSSLYTLNWLDKYVNPNGNVANIHAGFDETSELLIKKYPGIRLTILDFYDPVKHTEVSIKRARKLYSQISTTIKTSTTNIRLAAHPMDTIVIIFAAHEIRDENERSMFFNEVKRIIKENGKIIVTEHTRDWKNFLAYNIGFLHFYSKKSWRDIFKRSGLHIETEFSITPFITTFICSK